MHGRAARTISHSSIDILAINELKIDDSILDI